MKKVFVFSALIGLLTTIAYLPTTHSQGNGKFHRTLPDRRIAGQYVVVLNNDITDVDAEASRLLQTFGGDRSSGFTYHRALKGFSVRLNENQAQRLADDPQVAFVEEDSEVTLSATETGATWGLDRIDQRDLPMNGDYDFNATGTGVTVYIIDTGIRATHSEFGGRVISGFTAINDGNGTNDCYGHGTHVSGIVGGATYGVAKNVTLVAVRVMDCNGSGSMSGVIAGVDWVTSNHTGTNPAVANMSLRGSASSSLDAAVNNSIADGVTYAVAAGNSSDDACNYSPSRVPNALTVGSVEGTDARSSFSSFGTCVDIFAPGSNITSSYNTSDTATISMSGTSMASPHVAGVAALYLETNPGASPATVAQSILGSATLNKLTGVGTGSPNRLLYSFVTGPLPTPTPTPTPTPSPTPPPLQNPTPSPTPSPSPTPTPSFSLSAKGIKVKGVESSNLTWSGATSTKVDIWRNSSLILTAANNGSQKDNLNTRGAGSYTYRVCQSGTDVCSNSVTVVF